MKVILITSGQPSLNPRLVKEADALINAGHKVTVIYQYRNDWGSKLDQELFKVKKWSSKLIGGNPLNQKFSYWKSRINHKLGQLFCKSFGFDNNLAEMAISRCTLQFIKCAQKIPADLYIAHNLGALPAAIMAAKKNGAKCGFDAEDFHRNELSDDPKDFDVRIKTYLENKYLFQLDYLSTASPLISEEYKKLYPNFNVKTILNTFPKQVFNLKTFNESVSIKLFWFSQTIGLSRGIEDIIWAMGQLSAHNIELHLLGEHNSSTITYFDGLACANHLKNAIFYYSPIPESSIFSFAAKFDIGLATEIGFPKNRDICLTNKIFAYVQSGLAILASDTKSQVEFLKNFPKMGITYTRNNRENLLEAISHLMRLEILNKYKKQAKAYGNDTLNWEFEQQKFLANIKQIFS